MLAVTTRNKLHSIHFSLPMLRARRYVSVQLATTPGLIRYVSAIASPTEFLTLTVWENRQVMFNFMNSDAHRRFMWMFTRWSASFWSMRWMPTTTEEGAWNGLSLADLVEPEDQLWRAAHPQVPSCLCRSREQREPSAGASPTPALAASMPSLPWLRPSILGISGICWVPNENCASRPAIRNFCAGASVPSRLGASLS